MGYRGADAELERLVREWNVLELTSSVDSTRVYHIDTKIPRSRVRDSSLNSSHHGVLYRTSKLRTVYDMS
ncbi:hypothetical protein PC114_g24005 [Phytophthora cactorum]|uniref:Uncharacterized protein n=1 Tax=Phytophthora cactorum TaxID=29920 RepID=A0A8T1APP1_9STRA|nr:hypothetical protein PC114_g24005 [Phytophthora cactorum]KAG2884146.1 hypothetical protein PC115_g21414 [Phytophthora cactorum]KAG3004424.1 hypothetical protein PC120_g18574 [Phytophthora cactorum]KAG3055258.1 hypothetical protein PC122_g21772 [Phytophthora cactorum]